MPLEKMGAFFDARLIGYEEHQLTAIEFATEFYPYTASLLPKTAEARVLDLGCGTGLELDYYFKLNPTARVTGIDLASGMLEELGRKHCDRSLTLINGSYFDEPLGEGIFDAAVSVESLHHFTKARKLPLYTKLQKALKYGGYFILTDYFAKDDEYEAELFEELAALKRAEGITDGEFYHFDTPLTLEHETEALKEAGFSSVTLLASYAATRVIKAEK